MKKFIVLLTALTMVLAFSGAAMAAIDGSSHDLATTTGSDGENQICKYCHIPHKPQSANIAPLWNRATPAAGSFTAYGTTAAGTNISTVGGVSLLCLSCHDGATNLDAFGGTAGGDLGTIGSVGNVGTNLQDDHPVSVTATAGSSGMKGSFGSNVKFYSNKVECASCHDPHNPTGSTKMLRASLADSALCLECHNK